MVFLRNEAMDSWCTMIFAHGAGAPMDSAFMQDMSERLQALGVSVVRFEFPYMAQRRLDAVRRPPNQMAVLLDTWRKVYTQVRAQVAGPLVLAGKSMGGRIASMLADELQVQALVCLGYPFYPAGKTDRPRIEHLTDLRTPTLIVQGERDALGAKVIVQPYPLSTAIEFAWLAFADHDLKPLKRSGFTHEQYMTLSAQRIADFLRKTLV
ncbi:MAG: alpha/beta fold hydrolase [Gammaproteobacteria bacterium]|nr:alpha/beta fold hydrolase [Gammaproteobacteria bacterium]